MHFTEIQKAILKYVIEFYNELTKKATPCIEVLQEYFHGRYDPREIEENILELVSSGILRPYSFHSYLDLIETFKSSISYNRLETKLFGDNAKNDG